MVRCFYAALALIGMAASALAAGETAVWQASARKKSDRIEITGDHRAILLNVHSSDGIGSATIRRALDSWPAMVKVRLNLRNLEFFKVGNGTITVEGRLKSDRWEIAPAQGSRLPAAIRQMEAFIEIKLPAVLFAREPEAIVLEWIDAYRR